VWVTALCYKLLNYSTSSEILECAKCAALEFQLQQVREELSSVKLSIQLLNEERIQGGNINSNGGIKMGNG